MPETKNDGAEDRDSSYKIPSDVNDSERPVLERSEKDRLKPYDALYRMEVRMLTAMKGNGQS